MPDTSLKLSAFKALLREHPAKAFRLVLPGGDAVPVSFHITEVAHVRKRFIDCGGTLRTADTCQLQAWVGPDADHRLQAGKMARVLDLAGKVLPEGQDLDVEVEYEDKTVSQYPVAGYAVTDAAVVLRLASKHTDCLAKESCLPPARSLPVTAVAPAAAAGCCGGGAAAAGGCC
jgi:hypothetical protein